MTNEDQLARRKAEAHEEHLVALERFTHADRTLRATTCSLELDAMLALFATEVAYPMGVSHSFSVIAQMLVSHGDGGHSFWRGRYGLISRKPEFEAYRTACDLFCAASSFEQARDRAVGDQNASKRLRIP